MSRLRLLPSAAPAAVCASAAPAAVRIDGQVQAGAAAIANSVTLWTASAIEPRQLAQAKTDSDGRFEIGAEETPDPNVSFYLIASGGAAAGSYPSGDNPALALLSVLGGAPPANAVINEMTIVASVWTNAQFLDGGRSGATRPACAAPPATSPTSSISQRAATAARSRSRSTARRPRPWRISRHCRHCLRVARRGSRRMLATSCSRRRRRLTARFRQTH